MYPAVSEADGTRLAPFQPLYQLISVPLRFFFIVSERFASAF